MNELERVGERGGEVRRTNGERVIFAAHAAAYITQTGFFQRSSTRALATSPSKGIG